MKVMIKTMVQSAYDMQDTRLRLGGRLVANFKAKAGQAPSTKETDIDEAEAKKLLDQLRGEYKRITDGIAKNTKKADRFAGHELITSDAEYVIVNNYMQLLAYEESLFRQLGKVVEKHPIWDAFLRDVKGCGPAMAGAIIATLDPHKARYPSSFWKYCGLDVSGDGRGRSRRKEQMEMVEYVNKDGEVTTRKSLGYDPWIKTKLVGVMASCILRANDPVYRKVYDDYKQRIKTDPRHAEKTPGHINNMALRYMIKIFLLNLHMKWREIEGLEVTVSFHEGKQGHVHGMAA